MKRLLRSWLWKVPLVQEVDEEIAFHVEMRTRELVEQGMDPVTARQTAVARFGDVARLKQTCVNAGRKRDRDMRILQLLAELRDDVIFALRQLRSAPAFTLVAVTTLALGIGANSAVFALVDATLLRPLPFADPARLVAIAERSDAAGPGSVSPLNMLDWNARSRSFEQIAGFVPEVGGMVMAGADGNAETVPRQWVTAGIFDVLGVKAIAGRTFSPEDEQQRANVVVIGETFWRTRFNADPTVVGREIRLDGGLFMVIGVVPADFQLLDRSSVWAMRSVTNLPPRARGLHWLQAVGRLKPGTSMAVAEADLAAVAEGLARQYPQTNQGRRVSLAPLHAAFVGGDLRQTAILFLGVVGFVLLICCGNVANLLMARAAARARELAVRGALGAGRPRIVRQLVTESVVLSLIGGALGVGVGAVILNVAPSLVPQGLLPAAVTLAFDARVVAFCAGAALAVGLLFGLAPAWQATRGSAVEAMGSDNRTTTGQGGRLRAWLVTGEVATAVVLLFGAGLLLRTLFAVEAFDRGYRAESVLSMLVDPLGSQYPTPESLQQFYSLVEGEVRAVPGVRDAAWTSAVPLGESLYGDFTLSFEIAGEPPLDVGQRPATSIQAVSPTYFSTIDLPIVKGRAFDLRDTRDGVPVCIVNEALARGFEGSPIGRRLVLRPSESPLDKPVVREIVGVARQVKRRPDETSDLVQLYVPMAQDLSDDMMLMVRPQAGRATVLSPAIRAAISRVDKPQLVSVRSIITLEDAVRDATARHRFRAAMVMTFAALALMLAMVGVFGILAYSVQLRVRDFGVRRALGASTGDVLGLVVGGALRVVVIGAAIGLVAAAALGRLLTSVLFGVQPLDLLTFAAVTIVLAAAAAVSIAGPAWRAARIDPAIALRSQ